MARRRERVQPLTCDRCNVPNSRRRRYCYNCGAELHPTEPTRSSTLRVSIQVEVAVVLAAIVLALIVAGAIVTLTRP